LLSGKECRTSLVAFALENRFGHSALLAISEDSAAVSVIVAVIVGIFVASLAIVGRLSSVGLSLVVFYDQVQVAVDLRQVAFGHRVEGLDQ
jgi:hypothetical protein